jgi:hypothetical protein
LAFALPCAILIPVGISAGAVFAADGDVKGNLEIPRYILSAYEAREASFAESKGRLRAKVVLETAPSGTAMSGANTETIIEAVWNGPASMRTVAELDYGRALTVQKQRKLTKPQLEVIRYRVLSTRENVVMVQEGSRTEERPIVSVWAKQNAPNMNRSWQVLPSENCWEYMFQLKVSGVVRTFVAPPDYLNPKPDREISQVGDSVKLLERYKGGGSTEYVFSLAWEDRLVSYRSIPGGSMTLDQVGTMKWSRDAHGEVYLQEHLLEQSDLSDPGSFRSKVTFRVEEYDSQPVIDAKELTFEGLRLPDDATLVTFGSEPNVPVSYGTVGGRSAIPEDQSVQLEEVVEQLKSRGFARPERTK